MRCARHNSHAGDSSERAILQFMQDQDGGFFDFADETSLYLTDAATTRVTAVGDPVGFVRDKTDNGRNLFQAVTADRVVYGLSGGKAYMVGDEALTHFELGTMNFDTGTSQTFSFAYDLQGDTHGIFLDRLDLNSPWTMIYQSGSAGSTNDGFANLALHVNGKRISTYTTRDHFYDAINVNAGLSVFSHVQDGNKTTGATGWMTFKYGAGTDLYDLGGHMYGCIWTTRRLNITEINMIARYHAAKSGVIL